MLCGFHPQTTSITGLFNFNEEHIISFCIVPGAYAGLSSPWFFQLLPFALLWHSSRSCHSKPATMFTCSPPVFSNAVFFFFIIVYPPSLSVCLSVCPLPTSSTYHMNLPCPPYLTAPSSLQPRAPSPTSPVEFPMNVKQAYKAFAAVPRSLAVLEPPQVGRDAWTVSGSQTETHAVMIGCSHPATSSLELTAPCWWGACDVLWRVECGHLFFFFYPYSPAIILNGVDSFFHPPWTSWTNIHAPYPFVLYPAWFVTLCLFYIWISSSPDILHVL